MEIMTHTKGSIMRKPILHGLVKLRQAMLNQEIRESIKEEVFNPDPLIKARPDYFVKTQIDYHGCDR